MTCNCGWCGKELREICPSCGFDARPLFFSWRFLLALPWRAFLRGLGARLIYPPLCGARTIYECTNAMRGPRECRLLMFEKGFGGMNHGLCEPCNVQRFAQVSRERQVV